MSKKYGLSISKISLILRKFGVTRNLSESALLSRNGWTLWRRLVPISTSKKTKILSIPGSLIRQIGLDPSKELEGKWVVEGNRIFLEIRKKPRKAQKKSKRKYPLEWRKLARAGSPRAITRILSLPGKILSQAGYDPSKTLMGRWEIRGNRLELIVRYAEDLGIA